MSASFSSRIKDDLAHQQPGKKCCQLAELSAIIHMDGSLHLSGRPDRYSLDVSTENAAVARKVLKLFGDLFELRGEVTIRRRRLSDANNYLVHIPESPRIGQVLNELGILDDSLNIRYGIAPRLVRNGHCAQAYLRGLFMGGGFVGDPYRKYHFEITTGNFSLARDTLGLMTRFNLKAKLREKKNNYSVYLKGAEPIIQFLALIGAHDALLKWEDVRILKDMRANVNRLVNFDTANLSRSVEASISQIGDINLIEENIGIDNLTGGLAQLARVRLANPQANIEELGLAFNPQLGKSAVYHRIRRLRQIARKIRNNRVEGKE